MNEKITVNDFVSPLESLEQTLEILEEFYLHERFEDMDDAFELIGNYTRVISEMRQIGGSRW